MVGCGGGGRWTLFIVQLTDPVYWVVVTYSVISCLFFCVTIATRLQRENADLSGVFRLYTFTRGLPGVLSCLQVMIGMMIMMMMMVMIIFVHSD